MLGKGNLAVFGSSSISETREVTPIKIGVNAHLIKGNLAVFGSSNISETEEATPTKISVHTFDINPYLHEFFEPILND